MKINFATKTLNFKNHISALKPSQMINVSNLKFKQFLKRVKVRKTTLTNLIFNTIQKLNIKFSQKKHSQYDGNIDKLTLFLP